jgi:hypothetical protein
MQTPSLNCSVCKDSQNDSTREVIWPEETALQTKLYGPRPELERMYVVTYVDERFGAC